MLFEPCALSLSVSVSWCKWKAGLDLPMDFIKATVVSSLFLTTPKALPLSRPIPLSCGLGSWGLASPHELPLLLLSPLLLPDGVVGFLPPPPGVVGVGLVPCVEGECSRNGTRNAPIPAAMRAAAPNVRLLGTIILFSYLPLFSDPPSGLAILFKELYTQEPVNPFSLDVEIFQEPLMDIESRYTIRGFEGKGREPEYSEQSLAVRPSKTRSS